MTFESFMEFDQKVLLCRTYGHSWSEEKTKLEPDGITYLPGFRLRLRCDRCKKRREDVISENTGDLLSRSYTEPKGWKKPPSVGPLRAPFRLELMRRRSQLSQPPIINKLEDLFTPGTLSESVKPPDER